MRNKSYAVEVSRLLLLFYYCGCQVIKELHVYRDFAVFCFFSPLVYIKFRGCALLVKIFIEPAMRVQSVIDSPYVFYPVLSRFGVLRKSEETARISLHAMVTTRYTKHPRIARVRKQNLGSQPFAWSAFLAGAMRSFSRLSSRSTPGLSINHILHRTPLWNLKSVWNSLYFKQMRCQNIVFIHTMQTTAPLGRPACGRRHTSCIRRLLQASWGPEVAVVNISETSDYRHTSVETYMTFKLSISVIFRSLNPTPDFWTVGFS